MKIIESNVELIEQGNGLDGIYNKIEDCGRVCYKSEGNKKDGSAETFVNAMKKNHHGAMLEHGTVYLYIEHTSPMMDANYMKLIDVALRYKKNKYSVVNTATDNFKICYYITTNYRVLYENGWLDDLQYMCNPTENHEKRITLKFTCDRGVTHELVRHRTFSFAMESTRYCNYNSEKKFGSELTFICPSWINIDSLKDKANTFSSLSDMIQNCTIRMLFDDVYESNEKELIENANTERCAVFLIYNMLSAEKAYMYMIKHGYKPEMARAILPNSIKSEICMTGFESDWRFFFDLRLFGKTGTPHPDMLLLAEKAKKEFERTGYWDSIMKYESKFE